MKLAVASRNEKTVASHFGGATCYVVYAIEKGRVVGREVRAKPEHGGTGGGAHHEEVACRNRKRLRATLAPVLDCEILVARRMGESAYEGIQREGVTPLVTDIREVEDVARAYVEGSLVHHPEKVVSGHYVEPVDSDVEEDLNV